MAFSKFTVFSVLAITVLVVMSVDGHPPSETDTDMNQGNRGWQRSYGNKMHDHEHGHEHGHGCGHEGGGGIFGWVKKKLGFGTTSQPSMTARTTPIPTTMSSTTTTIITEVTASGEYQPDVVEGGSSGNSDNSQEDVKNGGDPSSVDIDTSSAVPNTNLITSESESSNESTSDSEVKLIQQDEETSVDPSIDVRFPKAL